MKEQLIPKRGAIATCSLGRMGLITSETAINVFYNDGNPGVSWVGIQLIDGSVNGVGGNVGKTIQQKVGDVWMSRNPKVICYIDDVVEFLKENFNNNLGKFNDKI